MRKFNDELIKVIKEMYEENEDKHLEVLNSY